LVVCRGLGYVVRADDPDDWMVIREVLPIIYVDEAPQESLVILADYVAITAYSATGHAWTSKRLSYDGLKVESLREGVISGRGWSAPLDRWVPFEVDLKTGTHVGGAAPLSDQ
jgi:hypothetical protein